MPIVLIASVSTAGTAVLIVIDQAVAEAAVPVRTVAKAVGLLGVRDVHFRGTGALTRGMEFDRVVANLATTRARLIASRDIGFAARWTIPVTHDDFTQ